MELRVRVLLGVSAAMTGTAVLVGAVIFDAQPASAVSGCSVFDRHPCHPTFCDLYQRRPCIPEIDYPIGQDLRLTIESANSPVAPVKVGADLDTGKHELETLGELFDALRACWTPPLPAVARADMQMSVRFSFKRNGEIIGTPRVTFTSPEAPSETRETYRKAILSALLHCAPLRFSPGLGGAVAGRPINIRFVDNRALP
jgi:hypothetical protein